MFSFFAPLERLHHAQITAPPSLFGPHLGQLLLAPIWGHNSTTTTLLT